MAPSALEDILSQAYAAAQDTRPLIPMYIHLILSALFPIYTGAHASLSRPSSAAKPEKRKKGSTQEDDDQDEEKVRQMEALSNKDAIVLPLTAAAVLAGLYFLIMRYGADLINLILGWYFSGIGVYSVAQLVNDALNFAIGFIFPDYYASGRMLCTVKSAERKAVRQDGKSAGDTPLPPLLSAMPLPASTKEVLWSLRSLAKQKYTLKAYVDSIFDLHLNITIINVLSAAIGVGTIIYVNTVSKPWFLTNLQGFAVSYSALQLMSPTSFATGSLILSALFCYDIWAVFFTPLMVTVAKNLDQPIKLVFPRPDEPGKTPDEPPVKSYSMLGLGDIVLPGIVIGLALRFDLYIFYLRRQGGSQNVTADASEKKTKEEAVDKAPYVSVTGRWGDRFWTWTLPKSALPARLRTSFPKPYFTATMIGYVVGMLTTLGVMSVFQHAQPALLYLVPGVLVGLWGTGLIRGELKDMWEFSEAITGEQLLESDSYKKTNDSEEVQKGLFERLWDEIWPSKDSNDNAKKSEAGKESPKPSRSSENGEADEARSTSRKLRGRDTILEVTLSRYKPASKEADHEVPADGGRAQRSTKASSSDVDGSAVPRYRTRSTRSTAE